MIYSEIYVYMPCIRVWARGKHMNGDKSIYGSVIPQPTEHTPHGGPQVTMFKHVDLGSRLDS